MGGDEKNQLDYNDVDNGPLTDANRQCRDVICLLLFLVNVVAMFYCTIFAYSSGDPNKIYRGTDKNKNQCGYGQSLEYPFLYFYDPTSLNFNNRVCVKSCPVYQGDSPTTIQCFVNPINNGTDCSYNVIIKSDGEANATSTSNTFIGYGTTALIERVCVPQLIVLTNAFQNTTQQFSSKLRQGQLGKFITDVKNNWQWILAAFGVCLVIVILYMLLLKILVCCIVWVSIFGIILLFIILGLLFLYNAGKLSQAEQYIGFLGIPTFNGSEHYDIYGYICLGVAGLLIILLLCCCSRIRIAVKICEIAGQFVVDQCRVVFVPIFQTLIILCLWAACLAVMVFLVSSANFVVRQNDVFTSIQDFTDPNLAKLYYFIFATLWSNAMIQAISIFVVASTCCMWYYSHGPGESLDSPILGSYKRVFRFHFGSLAFGSLILAIVQFLQFIVEVFKQQAQNSGVAQNQCFQYVINCLRCCLACVQRIVQFINKTAYIQIAIRGKNFCMAAKDGFELVWANPLRYAIVGGVGQIIMFIGKLMISSATTALFYCLITFTPSIKSNILEPIYLLIIVFIMSFAVATVFMSVYSLAMDTLLACFLVDEANQKARGGKKPLHAPEGLAELMDD